LDTNDLSPLAHKGIIITAENFDSNLTLQYGLRASKCKNEEEYLDTVERLTKRLQKMDEDELSWSVFFGEEPNMKELHKTLKQILKNIREVRKLPMEERG